MGNIREVIKFKGGMLEEYGYEIVRNFFDIEYIKLIRKNIEKYLTHGHIGVTKEDDEVSFRGIHGPHLFDDFFLTLATQKRLETIAQDVLGEPCYLHQFKINMKQGMSGQAWPWHEDFVYWNKKDGIEEAKLVNLALLIDDSDMLSGPLCFIPGTHKIMEDTQNNYNNERSNWEDDLSAKLNFQIDREIIKAMLNTAKPEYAIGKAGDLIVFNPLIAHCSASNLSPDDRRLLILTFNASSNVPKRSMGRPEFLCSR